MIRPPRAALVAAAALVSAAALAAAGCGDDRPADELVVARSGARLSTSWLAYDDGARQQAGGRFYDRREHTRCWAGTLDDGAVRCVPEADEAVYSDEACTHLVGRAGGDLPPTHFLLHEQRADGSWSTRVFRAGGRASPIGRFYQRGPDGCVGPLTADPSRTDYGVTSEVMPDELAAIDGENVGDGRLTVGVLTSDDGMRLPVGMNDGELRSPCSPVLEPDRHVRCQPDAPETSWFADDACQEPVAVVEDGQPVPARVSVPGADGCPRFYRVGAPIDGPLYHRGGAFCNVASIGDGARAFAAGAPLAIAELTRTVDEDPRHRLQPIVLAADGVGMLDRRMYDSAIGADCVPVNLGDGVRCLPAPLATTTTLFTTPSCGAPADVVLLPQQVCGVVRFARGPSAPPDQLRVIGDTVRTPLYQQLFGACIRYQPAAGQVAHAVGPVLDPALFVGAVVFEER